MPGVWVPRTRGKVAANSWGAHQTISHAARRRDAFLRARRGGLDPGFDEAAPSAEGMSRGADLGPDGEHRLIALSLVLCSRNDRHGGNSVWRLQTTLNYLGHQVASLGHDGAVEVIVTDWGSATPLRKVLSLSPAAARQTRFLEVAPDRAAAAQQDSPFPEVLANNAAVRRARGEFIGRIDQDTLVGAAFLERFLSGAQGAAHSRWREAMLFMGRRSIPHAWACHSPPFAEVVRVVERLGPYLPREGRGQAPWFDAPVGVVLLHRELWDAYRGYDERMLYWGFMEADLGLRAARSQRVLDLEAELGGTHFYHLAHSRAWLAPTTRRMNPRRLPSCQVPNGEDWGFAGVDLPLCEASASESTASEVAPPLETPGASARPRGALGPVCAEWTRQILLTAARLGRRAVTGDRIERAA